MKRLLIIGLLLCAWAAYGNGTNTVVAHGTTNILSIDPAGRIVFAKYPWRDSMVPAVALRVGATAPTLNTFAGGPARMYEFDNNQDDEFEFSVQFNHDVWVSQPYVYPHLHWAEAATTSAGTNVVFELSYHWASINETFTGASTVLVTNYVTGTNWTHRLSSFGAIANPSKGISSIMVGRVRRLANGSASDDFDKGISILGFDVHYQVDTAGGSDGETSK